MSLGIVTSTAKSPLASAVVVPSTCGVEWIEMVIVEFDAKPPPVKVMVPPGATVCSLTVGDVHCR